jgi:hypothetical protein
MVLYLCVLIVFSLHRELLKLILETNPFWRWFCHRMVWLVLCELEDCYYLHTFVDSFVACEQFLLRSDKDQFVER